MANRGRLLVVDDQPIILEAVERQLAINKYETMTALSGEAGLEILRFHEIDILITDIQMPGMDGIELMQEALKLYPDMCCIVIAGHADTGTALEAMRLGAANFLLKPLNTDTLILSIEKSMEKVRLVRENKRQQENLASINKVLLNEINKSRMILNAAGEGIVGIDADGHITFANPAAEHLLGWSVAELIGVNLHDLTHNSKPNGEYFPTEKCPVCAACRGGAWYQGSNMFFSRKDGRYFPIRYVSSPIVEDGKSAGAVVIFNDITEIKQAEEKLSLYRDHLEEMVEKRTAQLEKANRQLKKDIAARKKAEKEAERHRLQLIEADKMVSLGTLVAGVAHEINNPNNFIMMNTPLLRRAWDDCRRILEKYYEENGDFLLGGLTYSEMRNHVPELFAGIWDGSERIKQIVLSLKNYARQETADLSQIVDVNDVLGKALVLLANPLKKTTNHLIVKYGENIPAIHGNFQRIEQVLINVIQNACHAVQNPEDRIEITTFYNKKKRRVVVEIKDEGRGISQKNIKQIQDPFFTTKRSMGGTGLGLSISAGIIEEHQGKIVFKSKEGRGTTVRIELPEYRTK